VSFPAPRIGRVSGQMFHHRHKSALHLPPDSYSCPSVPRLQLHTRIFPLLGRLFRKSLVCILLYVYLAELALLCLASSLCNTQRPDSLSDNLWQVRASSRNLPELAGQNFHFSCAPDLVFWKITPELDIVSRKLLSLSDRLRLTLQTCFRVLRMFSPGWMCPTTPGLLDSTFFGTIIGRPNEAF
jgi:hypothetical protein